MLSNKSENKHVAVQIKFYTSGKTVFIIIELQMMV